MPLLHPSPTHLPTETTDPIPVPNDSDLSDSLVPQQTLQSAAVSTVSFDGLLNEPLLLREDLKEGCGGRLWPAGMLLAKHLLRHHRSDLVDKSIVELGAGGGLVGLAVARGCHIDSSSSPSAPSSSPIYITDQTPMLPLMEINIKLNNLSSLVSPVVLDWGEPIPDNIPSRPAVVLAADCVYFEPAFPLLVSTLESLLAPGSVCYFCFKKRRRADIRFFKLARKIFDIVEIRDDPDVEAARRESIFLYSIRPKLAQGSKNGTRSSNGGIEG